MGAKNSKHPVGLRHGTVKIHANKLYQEGVVVVEPGQVEIGSSKDLVLKISSDCDGKFHLCGKYVGVIVKEITFSHDDLISLLHASNSSAEYQDLAQRLAYRADGCKLMMSRAFGLDVNKLLLLLYDIFSKQDLPAKAEQLVQEKQLGRVRSMSQSLKQRKSLGTSGSPLKSDTQISDIDPALPKTANDQKGMRSDSYNTAMDEHVKALEQLTRVSALSGANKSAQVSSTPTNAIAKDTPQRRQSSARRKKTRWTSPAGSESTPTAPP
eukprot:m.284733 g.284733  ORF g.284733 m.284733 type:complete len:268 (-) comp19913_c0_seq10:154-957(-)